MAVSTKEPQTAAAKQAVQQTAHDRRAQMDELTKRLQEIHPTCGREVTYEDENGKVRPYWPNRFLQALKSAMADDDVVGLVGRLIDDDDETRGFGYLVAANRVDLTVEAIAVEFPALLTPDRYWKAVERVRSHGYQPKL